MGLEHIGERWCWKELPQAVSSYHIISAFRGVPGDLVQRHVVVTVYCRQVQGNCGDMPPMWVVSVVKLTR